MDFGTVILALIVIGIIVVIVLANRDYTTHKDDNVKDLDTADKKLTVEREDRLGNINYVVGEVNRVNTDIYTAFTSNIDTQTAAHNTLNSSFSNVVSGLNGLLRLNTSSVAATPAYLPLLNLPGVGVVDMELLKHVTATSGMTVKGLMSTSNVEFCHKDKCIKFPDTNGNTYLTSFATGKSIVLDAPTAMYSDLTLKASAMDPSAVTLKTSTGSVLNIAANKVGISMDPAFAPSAAFHVAAAAETDPFKVSAGTSDAILVKANGDIQIGGANGPTLKKDADNGLTITGNVNITGNIVATGSGNINGKPLP
jgi:hypothetical protein